MQSQNDHMNDHKDNYFVENILAEVMNFEHLQEKGKRKWSLSWHKMSNRAMQEL